MTQFRLYDRISTIDDDIGTIKFVGYFPPDHNWKNTLIYGIEWDNPDRGKNNGNIDDKSYFKVDVPLSGSFIKFNNKKICHDRFNFIEVFIREYYNVDNYHERNIKFGTKLVEELGFEKLNRIQSEFKNLSSVSLNGKGIVDAFDNDEEAVVFKDLQNITYLDLSFNLFNNLSSIYKIISHLNNLSNLNLNGNKFPDTSLDSTLSSLNHESLTILKLNSTNISINQVNLILKSFPNLSQIHLSNNNYTDTDLTQLNLPPHVKFIDLSFNKLSKLYLSSFPHIETLLISDNHITTISDLIINKSIQQLDIRYNQVNEWTFIDQLSIQLPNLQNLRINNNPVFEIVGAGDQTEDQMVEKMFIQLIARFECEDHKRGKGVRLSMINGSPLLESEIRNAELYFISKYKSTINQPEYVISNKIRWEILLQKYNVDDKVDSTIHQASNKVQLKINNENEIFTKTILLNLTILKLKGIISRSIMNNSSILNFHIYYYQNDLKEYLDTNVFSQINEFNLSNNQTIYIENALR